jgi:signal transduction histidine kinase
MDLASLCRHVTEEAQAAHSERTIRLTLDNDLRGEWDYARLAQVLSNLVSNALIHGERHSPIWIAATGDDGTVTITVANRAQPIAQKELERLFEPFRQGEQDTPHRRSGGLGLGLYIASEIVQSHGGSISACSSEGVVTFKVRLARDCGPWRMPAA